MHCRFTVHFSTSFSTTSNFISRPSVFADQLSELTNLDQHTYTCDEVDDEYCHEHLEHPHRVAGIRNPEMRTIN
jgi:hypothetical protein